MNCDIIYTFWNLRGRDDMLKFANQQNIVIDNTMSIRSVKYTIMHNLRIKPNRFCQSQNCMKRSSFGYANKLAMFCVSHKLEGMIDVKSKRCQFPGCITQPTYGEIGSKLAIFCVSHKLESMIDVKHKRCQFPGCITQPNYGLYHSPSITCAKHKLDCYIMQRYSKPKCIICGE